jgi:DNA repair protein RadC
LKYEIISTRKCRKTLKIKHPEDFYNFLKKKYARSKQEHFIVATLNGAHEVIAIHIASIGLVNRTIIHPREIFIHAIRDMASSIVVVHNHPSGNVTPSLEDVTITDRIKKASAILGFNFLDHIIIGKDNLYSFRREHYILRQDVL